MQAAYWLRPAAPELVRLPMAQVRRDRAARVRRRHLGADGRRLYIGDLVVLLEFAVQSDAVFDLPNSAVALAVSRAAVTISGLRRARIVDTHAVIENGRITAWKVDLRVTFEIKDALHE